MRLRGLVGVILVGCSACQCLQPVGEGDARPGRDSGTLFDAGNAFDAGSNVDAGTPDDAGTTHDAGSPEVCDGVDNDLDGIVDQLPDGGALTRTCPLQLGVCTGSFSKCINRAFAECEYGADYQRVEDRCDGIDNDCDGRIDKSRPKVLIQADAGQYPPRMHEVWKQQVFRVPTGLMVNLPQEMLWLAQDLSITNRVQFPYVVFNEGVSVLPNGEGWTRIVAGTVTFLPPELSGAGLHLVRSDGGFDLNPDGSVEFVAFHQTPDRLVWESIAGVATDAGWVVVMNGASERSQWMTFGRDGSSSVRSDHGGLLRSDYPTAYGSNFYVVDFQNCSAKKCDLDAACTVFAITDAGLTGCTLTTLDPLIIHGSRAWRDSSGASLGYDSSYSSHTSSEFLTFGVREARNDAGQVTHSDFAVVGPDGGWFDYERVRAPPNHPISTAARISRYFPLEGHLGLFVFSEGVTGGATCPICDVGDLSAEYICLP